MCESVLGFVDGGAETAKVLLAKAGVGEGVGGDGESEKSSGELRGGQEESDHRHRNACCCLAFKAIHNKQKNSKSARHSHFT